MDLGTRVHYLLLDHDNADYASFPLADVLRGWLGTMGSGPTVGEVVVRAYGGWWRAGIATTSRHEAASYYSTACPAILQIGASYWRTRFEFADRLAVDSSSPRIEETFVLRPASPLVKADASGGCAEAGCESSRLRKWLFRRRGCTKQACPRRFGDLWQRAEQKQVDTHLVVDFMSLLEQGGASRIAVASDDSDFLPAFAWAAASGRGELVTHIRFKSIRSYLDAWQQKNGIRILRLAELREA